MDTMHIHLGLPIFNSLLQKFTLLGDHLEPYIAFQLLHKLLLGVPLQNLWLSPRPSFFTLQSSDFLKHNRDGE